VEIGRELTSSSGATLTFVNVCIMLYKLAERKKKIEWGTERESEND
jgi:hypothetical protein